MHVLGSRGQTVDLFGRRLSELSKIHGSVFDRPQLMIKRQFGNFYLLYFIFI